MSTDNETTKRRKRRVHHVPLSDAERAQAAIGAHSVFREQPKRRRRIKIRHIPLSDRRRGDIER